MSRCDVQRRSCNRSRKADIRRSPTHRRSRHTCRTKQATSRASDKAETLIPHCPRVVGIVRIEVISHHKTVIAVLVPRLRVEWVSAPFVLYGRARAAGGGHAGAAELVCGICASSCARLLQKMTSKFNFTHRCSRSEGYSSELSFPFQQRNHTINLR